MAKAENLRLDPDTDQCRSLKDPRLCLWQKHVCRVYGWMYVCMYVAVSVGKVN